MQQQRPSFDPVELVGPAALGLLIGVSLVAAIAMIILSVRAGEETSGAAPAEATPAAAMPGMAGLTAPLSPEELAAAIDRGQQVASSFGCAGCHSTDGSILTGPTWKGLFGSQVTLSDGTTVTADETYIQESILDPRAKVVEGFTPVMPSFQGMSDTDVRAVIEWIRSLQ